MNPWLYGLLELPWWGYIIVVGVTTQITIAAVTLYLHRSQAHRAVELHPWISHFFRFWLWLTTGMRTKEWVAVHRKHHARCETEEDPHSPQVLGINRVLWAGAWLYRKEAANTETLDRYGHGSPDDWIERHLYTPHTNFGVWMLAGLNLALFGLPGAAIWLTQVIWIPLWAAGVINGLGHWWGYRSYETADASTNLAPWALWIGGEELHNNHHAYPSSARFSLRCGEIDIGWWYLRLLRRLGLARILREAPRPVIDPAKKMVDLETVKAVVLSRMHVMRHYAREVMLPVLRQELRSQQGAYRNLLKRARRCLLKDESRMDEVARLTLHSALQASPRLTLVVLYRRRLQRLWATAASQDRLLATLQEWCSEAEASGIAALQEFAALLRGYSLRPA